jgi:hypothetical protein
MLLGYQLGGTARAVFETEQLPQSCDGQIVKDRINADESQVLQNRLGRQHAVKGIFVGMNQ